MIARLRGLLDGVGADHAVIDCGGVGYLVFCSRRTLSALGAVGDPVAVHVETHVREDHIHLYGFADLAERDWFRLLTTVQGVGVRVALSILSVLAPDALTLAIVAQDRTALSRADGVGPKLAARLVLELKDKVGGIPATAPMAPAGAPPAADGVAGDAVSALVNLGYGRTEAFAAVTRVRAGGAADRVEAIIPAALRLLAPQDGRR
jgi:Holliday junction DNA helicase RuvA